MRLVPTAAGVFDGALQINSSDALIPQIVVGLKFTVLPLGDMADLQFSPNPLKINAPVNSTTSYAMLAVTNIGGVTPAGISVSFAPAAIQSLFVTGINLNAAAFTPGTAIQIPIFFYPTAAGIFNGEVVLTASGMTSANHPYQRTVRVPLEGNAGASTIRLLTRTPTNRDFRPVELGDIPAPRPLGDTPQTSVTLNLGTIQPPVIDAASVFILNQGTLVLEIPTMLGSWANPTGNQVFPIRIDAGKWAEVQLDFGTFRAPGIGAFSETLRILSNDPVTPEAHVIINGAVGGAKARIAPEFIDFSTVGLNTVFQRTTEFQNQGTVDLHIHKMVWRSGTDFRLVQPPTLPYLVPAGWSLTLTIEFGPGTIQGFYGDTLVLGTVEGISASLGVQAKAY